MSKPIPIFDVVYKDCETDIKSLKYKASSNFKNELQKMGFRLVAEWIDYNLPILYNDIYLVFKDNALYSFSFSAGTKYIILNGQHKFQRFDTIQLQLAQKRKSYYGYKINSDSMIERSKDMKKSHPANKSLKYRDLLRLAKIEKLLTQN